MRKQLNICNSLLSEQSIYGILFIFFITILLTLNLTPGRANAYGNIVTGKPITASGYQLPYSPNKAVDGSITTTSRWYEDTGLNSNAEKWLKVDLGSIYQIDRWVVKGMGEAGWGNDCNPRDFRLQKSTDGSTWSDVDVVKNNSSSNVDRNVSPFDARYVRLYIDFGNQLNNQWASIMEFELYGDLDTQSSNANLDNLELSAGTLSPPFSSDVTSYTASVGFISSSVNVTPTVAASTATVKVNSLNATSGSETSVPLNVGDNTITVQVTAPDGITQRSYTITVTRAAPSNNANLSSLALSNGSLTPSFAASTNSYTASVGNSTSSINVIPTVADSTATVKVNEATVTSGTPTPVSLNVGSNTITVVVTAQDGTTTNTYTFTVTRLTSNANLSNLTLNASTLNPPFASGTTSYTVNVPNTTTTISVTASVYDTNATLKINGSDVQSGSASAPISLAVGTTNIPVDVTAQDGSTVQHYFIAATRVGSSYTDLREIQINEIPLPGFNPNTTSYTYNVSNNVTSATVSGTVYDPNEQVSNPGTISLSVGNNPVYLDVTAQDGSTNRYTVNIERAGSSNTTLSALTTSIGTLSPSFEGDVYAYTVNVPNETTSFRVTASVYDPNASFQVNGTSLLSGQSSGLIPLQVGSNSVQLLVTAQDHSTATYTITAHRAVSSRADLSGLVINQGSLAPSFDPGTLTYSVDIPYETDSLRVTASVYDPNATLQINGVPTVNGTASNPISLQGGSNLIQVVVVAQDGVSSKTYTLNVTRNGHSSNSSSSGSISGSIGGQLTVNYSPFGTSAMDPTSPAALTKMLGSDVSLTASVLTTDGTSIQDITISPDGQFNVGSNVAAGQYQVVINVIAPNGQVLAGKSGTLTVNSNGTASMKTDLIDPYGVITDSVTKQPIPGVNVQLYWADTPLNRSKGRTPDTQVTLPELPDFAPNQNHNPQISTADGRYGWMVFPDGDYYVIAEKEDYQTYDSRKDTRDEQQGDTSYIRNGLIHVGKTIVELSFNMISNNTTNSSVGGYVKGYPDGTFHPDSPITRAELASILSRVLPLTSVENKKGYPDVASTHWALQSIQEMTGNQVMGGYPDGTFHPDSPITRAEMASIVTRVKHLETKQASFSDTTNHWASASIGAAQAAGFIGGYLDGTFHPDQSLTRAETVTIVNRMMGITDSQHTSKVTWKDVPSTYWAYDQIQNASR